MWWLVFSLLPLFAIVTCSDDRQTQHKPPKKPSSSSSHKSSKSGGSSKRRSKSKRHSKRSSKGDSGKSSRKSGKSSKKGGSSKSRKSSKSGKSKKERSGKSKKSSRKSGRSSKSRSSAKNKPGKGIEKSAKHMVRPAILSKETVQKPSQKPLTPVVPVVVDVPVSSSKEVLSGSKRKTVTKIRVEPAEMSFKSTGGLMAIKVANNSDERRAFKVKCSDNQLYRVSPVVGIVEAHKTIVLDVMRNNGTVKVDKLIVVSGKAKEDATTPKEALPASGCQKTVVPLLTSAA